MNIRAKILWRIYISNRIQNTKIDMVHATYIQINMQQHFNIIKLSGQNYYKRKIK